jgi:hypothetical protein
MAGCLVRQLEDRLHKIRVVRQARQDREEMAGEVGSRVRVEVSSGKEDRAEQEARRAVAAIKSPRAMTAPIPFPM